MADQTAVFRAVADFSQLRREAKAAAIDLKALDAAASGIGRSAASSAGGVGAAAAATGSLGKASKSSTGAVAAAAAATGKMGHESRASVAALEALNRSLVQNTQHVSKANSGLVGFIQSLGVLRTAVASSVVAVGALTAAGAAIGIKFNASLEQANIGFKNMFNDASRAEAVIAQIVSYARVTPFDTAGLIQQVRMLVGAGFEMEEILVGADEAATGLAVTIGDAAAAMGGGRDVADSMASAMARIKATGRVTFEELRIFAERGVPAIEILQEKLNLTAQEVQRIGDLGIDADVAISALQEGLNERFGGAMAEQSRTMLGLVSTFKDNIEIGMGLAFEGLFEGIKSGLMGVTDFMTELTILSEEIGFVDALAEKLPIIGPLIQSVTNVFAALADVVQALAPAFEVFLTAAGAGLVALTGVLNTAAGALRVFADIIEALPDGAIQFAAALMLVRTGLGAAALPMANLTAAMARMAGAAGAAGAFTKLQLLSGAFARMGPPGLMAAAAITAVGAAIYLASRDSNQIEKNWQTASEKAEILAGASEHLEAAIGASTGEVMKNSDAWKEWLKETEAVRAELRSLEDKDLQDSMLSAIAAQLVIDGLTPEEAFAQVRALADAVFGETYKMPVTVEGLEDPAAAADAIVTELQNELSRITLPAVSSDGSSAAVIDSSDVTNLEAYLTALAQLEDSASDIGTQIAGLFQLDASAGLAALIEAQHAIQGMGLPAEDTARAIDLLNDAFRESMGVTSDGGNSASTYADMLELVAQEATNLSEEQKQLVDVFNQALASTRNVDMALAAVEQAMAGAAGGTDSAADAMEGYTEAMQAAVEADAATQIAEQMKATIKAFEDFVDPADTFMALLGEVSDEGKLAAQQAAHDAGLSADEWKRFPLEAGVGLKDWRVALQNSLVHQRDWIDNLAAATEKFGPEVAKYFRDAGPEMAGALAAMVEDTTGESEKLAELIREDAEMATEEFATEFVDGITTTTAEVVALMAAGVPDIAMQSSMWGSAMASGVGAGVDDAIAHRRRLDAELGRPLPQPGGGGGGGGTPTGSAQPQRRGGFVAARHGYLPDEARIQPEGTLVQWAEPGTGGEAFIPMGSQNRDRSLRIWEEVGRRFGMLKFARGGFLRNRVPPGNISDASEEDIDGHIAGAGNDNPFQRPGGSSGSSSGGTSSGGSSAAAIQDAADAADELADKIKEAAENFRDFVFESKDTAGQIKQLNRELANTVQFTDEWMDLMGQRQQLFDQMRADITGQVNTLSGLLDQARDIRQSRRDRRQQFRDDRAALVTRRNQQLERIDSDHAERLVDLAADRDSRLASLARRRDDAIENADRRLSKSLESAAERRSDSILDADQRLADGREALAEQTADRLAQVEKNLQRSIEGRATALSRSLDPLQRYEQAWANTTQAILDNFTNQNAQFDATLAGINALRSAGLSLEAIELLGLNSGPEALSQIERLRTASSEEIAELNRLASGRQTTAMQLATNISDDLFAAAADSREQVLADAARSEERLVQGYQRTLGDIQQQYDRALRDANAAHAESIASAEASYAESSAEVHATYTQSVADANASAAAARQEVRQQFQESMADLRADFLADMDALNDQLNSLGEDQGRTWAQAIRQGLRSGIPGIVALAREIQRSINNLQGLENSSPNMPGQTNPNAPGGAANAGQPGGPGGGLAVHPNENVRRYTLQGGETAANVVERFNTTLARLRRLNPNVNIDRIGRGDQIYVPRLHDGGLVTGRGVGPQSEVLRILQTGEGVMSRDAIRSITAQGGLAKPGDLRGVGAARKELHVKIVTPDGRVLWQFVKPYKSEDEILQGVMSGG
jgi:tape measure domain-containing protein